MLKTFKDKAGVEVNVGDLVVYGHNLGRCAGLRYGLVLAVQQGKDPSWVTREPDLKIKVIGIDDDWDSVKPKLLSKASVLAFGSRVLCINKEQCPQKTLELLVEAAKKYNVEVNQLRESTEKQQGLE